MLHEILLSLSLFDKQEDSLDVRTQRPSHHELQLSPSDLVLVSSLDELGDKHRKLARELDHIVSARRSCICTVVALSAQSTVLSDFQQCILDVEDGILSRNARFVGAYGIAPLSNVVREFEPWAMRLSWLLRMTTCVTADSTGYNGTFLLNWLRTESQTGYTDIHDISKDLCKTAENAWLRELSSWLFYGQLPKQGSEDFLIHSGKSSEKARDDPFCIDRRSTPNFVTAETAKSILFIGRSWLHLQRNTDTAQRAVAMLNPSQSRPSSNHVQRLANLPLPISKSTFSSMIESIRLTLAKDALQRLHPREKTVEFLQALRDFLLLGQGEFAVSLITQAERVMATRSQGDSFKNIKKGTELKHIRLKEGEATSILERAWAALASDENDEEYVDHRLEMGRNLLTIVPLHNLARLEISPVTGQRFQEFLCGYPTAISVRVVPPMDILFAQEDVEIYTEINAYLLAIRKTHLHLSHMWQLASLRKEHSSASGSSLANKPSQKAKVAAKRERWNRRMLSMRRMWSTCSATLNFLAELGNYYQQDVVSSSWTDIWEWLQPSTMSAKDGKSSDYAPQTSGEGLDSDIYAEHFDSSNHCIGADDPEAIAMVHKYYIESVLYGLLLRDTPFTTKLYDLLRDTEYLIAYTRKLERAWQRMDLEVDEGVFDADSDLDVDNVWGELDATAVRIKQELSTLLDRLRTIDGLKSSGVEFSIANQLKTGFTPRKTGPLDRLLTKFDFGGLVVA
ncbi:MAG: hypothetical protein M1814_000679 [Vezdaea aestivalis]|nr:MAG: hypothetical protein M1814_000679 [Vezdaea aestivalis]